MPEPKSHAIRVAENRARQRAMGLRSIEAALHLNDIAILDRLKERLGVASRSEVLRVLIAKADQDAVTPADVAILQRDAA
jgi:hypothetical protein